MKLTAWAVAALISIVCATAASAEEDGMSLYNRKCSTCHQKNGAGIEHAYPALSNDGFLLGAGDEEVIKLIFKGRDGMPAWAFFLKDDEIAKILTYARGAWGNTATPITPDVVAAARAKLGGDGFKMPSN